MTALAVPLHVQYESLRAELKKWRFKEASRLLAEGMPTDVVRVTYRLADMFGNARPFGGEMGTFVRTVLNVALDAIEGELSRGR